MSQSIPRQQDLRSHLNHGSSRFVDLLDKVLFQCLRLHLFGLISQLMLIVAAKDGV